MMPSAIARKITPLIWFIGCSFSCTSQSYQPAAFLQKDRVGKVAAAYSQIDSIYTDFALKNHAPGLVFGLVIDGQLVHSGHIGYTNVAQKTRTAVTSDFRVASMTKSFVAMAILKLRDEGKLRLDDPASQYIPEMKNIHYLTSDASPITLRHLLTHAAGFPEDNPWGDRQLAISNQDLLDFYKKGISFSNNPGTSYEYSNLGFTTLGYIIKMVSGQTYEDYITENILKPLGMTHTYWEYDKIPVADLAQGYRWLNSEWVQQPMLHDGAYGAMGGMITTIEDFAKYVALHLDAWPARDGDENGPIKRSSVREMQFPWNFSALNPDARKRNGKVCPTASAYAYGLGWAKDCDDRTIVGHTGGLPGFGSNWAIMPEYGIGVLCFANVTYANASSPNRQALYKILEVSGLQPRTLPPSAVLTRRRDELVNLLPDFANAESNKIFAQNFFMDYFVVSLQKEAREIFSKAGKILHVNPVVPENNLRGFFTMEGEKGSVKITFTLTPEIEEPIQEYHIEFIKK